MKQKHIITIILILILTIISIIITINYLNKNETTQKNAILTFYPTNQTPISITCEIADSTQEKTTGLMYRENLTAYQGMLFIYEQTKNLSFWMKNVLIPLDIIFLNQTGVIINIESADIQINISDNNLTKYYSKSPAKYVIEVNQGFCQTYGINIGTSTSIKYK